MFCGLEEERTKLGKKKEKKGKKREKKEKDLIAAKIGLVGIKGYLKTLPCEIFFAALQPFLTETAFYVKLVGRFSGFKTKVT